MQTQKLPLSAPPAYEGKSGVAVLLVRNGSPPITWLSRRRAAADGFAGYLCCPGGKPEHGENLYATASREIEEECGLVIAPERFEFVGAITIWKKQVAVPVWLFIAEITESEEPITPSGVEATMLGPWEPHPLMMAEDALTPGTEALLAIAKTRYGSAK